MYSSTNYELPSAPSVLKMETVTKYPELHGLSSGDKESTNFRLKKIMDDEKFLQDEIKFRNKLCKKYGRYSAFTDALEYTLILGDIVVGTLAATVPGVGSVVSSAAFSGAGLISGMAKMIQAKLNDKKMKHDRLSVAANTILSTVHDKISRAIMDGHITHDEFIDIQKTIDDWKNKPDPNQKQYSALTSEQIQLLTQQATEKAQKDIIEKLKTKQP